MQEKEHIAKSLQYACESGSAVDLKHALLEYRNSYDVIIANEIVYTCCELLLKREDKEMISIFLHYGYIPTPDQQLKIDSMNTKRL